MAGNLMRFFMVGPVEMFDIGFHILVAPARNGQHHHILRFEFLLSEDGQRVRRFQRRDDPFEGGQFESGFQGFVVRDGPYFGPAGLGEVGVDGADARIVQPGGDRIGFGDLSVRSLYDERAGAVDDSFAAEVDRGGRMAGVDTQPGGFGGDQLHAGVVQVVVEGARGIAASAYAGDQIVGPVAALFGLKLFFDLFADDRLETGHHVGVGVGTYGGADDVMGIGRVAAPVADRFVRRVFEGHVAAPYGPHFGAEHLHFLHVEVLPFDVGCAHIDDAPHPHQCADGGRSHAVLSGSGFGDDAGLAHAPGQQDLADGVVDFVRPGVVEVFAFEVDLRTVTFAHPRGEGERRGTSHIIGEQVAELFLESGIVDDPQVFAFQVLDVGVEDFGDICSSEASVVAVFIYVVVHGIWLLHVFLAGINERRAVVRPTALLVHIFMVTGYSGIVTTSCKESCATTMPVPK